MARIRIAVIGTGFGVRVQIPGFQESDEFDVVAVGSHSAERARAVADRCGIPHAFSDHRELLALPVVVGLDVPALRLALAHQAFETALGGWERQLCEIVGFWQSIVDDAGSGPTLKVLMTAAHKSITAIQHIDPRDHISLQAGNVSSETMQQLSFEKDLQRAMNSGGLDVDAE